MSWNYRVCKAANKVPEGKDPERYEGYAYGIHEAYYNERGEIWATTEKTMSIKSFIMAWDCANEEEALASIKDQLEKMAMALEKPVVDLDTIIWGETDWDDDDEMPSDIEELTRD